MSDKDRQHTMFDEAPVHVAPVPEPALPPPAPPLPPVHRENLADVKGMHPTALVFLDQPIARKLAVAWSLTGRAMADDEWIRAAGLEHTTEAKRVCVALRMHNVCRDGGVTDELAMRYITTLVAAPLNKGLNKGKKGSK